MRADHKRRVAEQAHAAEDRACRDHVNNCLQKRLGRCGHQGGQRVVDFAPGEVAEVADGRVRRTAELQRGVMLAPVAIDQDTG